MWNAACSLRVQMERHSKYPERRSSLRIPVGDAALEADISIPAGAQGIVLFAHGSGSSRHSSRNRHVAGVLNNGNTGTILIDLLTEAEEAVDNRTGELRFNIDLLAERLMLITDWVAARPDMRDLALGYFGASTGAAAALMASAARSKVIRAVVSRGGRPDLAAGALHRVIAPCLFIVGGEDATVLQLNRKAIAELPAETVRKLEIVPRATHLFEEPGALDQVAALALMWFQKYLTGDEPVRRQVQ